MPVFGEVMHSDDLHKFKTWTGSAWETMDSPSGYTNQVSTTTGHITSGTISTTNVIENITISSGYDGQWYTYATPDNQGTVLEDYFPDMAELDEMRKLYPTLDNAWEKFKFVYRLTVDDYKDKNEQDD
jgi:hypothetical protein